ncbi:ABC transporter ATP-binding protein [Agrobacterium fabrum]
MSKARAERHLGAQKQGNRMDGKCAIDIDHVSMTYKLYRGRTFTAIDNVAFNVRPGEFVAIIGPSGCGKSTLLRLVASLEKPTAGRVAVDGRDPSEMSRQHRLGVAFQDHALLPWLSVRKNMAIPFKAADLPVDWQRVDELLALVGLSQFGGVRPGQLSGGMRQRVSIARALVLRPSVLLLDEPFGALDAVTRRHLNMELQKIWSAEAITTLLVTHGVDEALFLADKVVVMSGRPGKITRVLDVPFQRPRLPELMRSPQFHKLADELTLALEPDGTV